MTFGCFNDAFEEEVLEDPSFELSVIPTSEGHHDAGSVICPKQVPSLPFDVHVALLVCSFVLDPNAKSCLLLFLFPESRVANSWTQIVEGDDLYVYPLLVFDCALPWSSLCRFCLSA